jgi:hypothetical protein
MKEIQIVCKRGSARIAWRKSFIGISLKILTGQRRKWDDFNWSFFSDSSEIALQGLWRGRYADAVASTEEVLRALPLALSGQPKGSSGPDGMTATFSRPRSSRSCNQPRQ